MRALISPEVLQAGAVKGLKTIVWGSFAIAQHAAI